MLRTDGKAVGSFDDIPTLDEVLPPEGALEATLRDLVACGKRALETLKQGEQVSAGARDQARALLEELGQVLGRAEGNVSALQVADDGTWFATESGRVDVARRGAVRRILAALTSARIAAPTKALSVDELFQIGWPGERIPYESQVRRVYTAIWTLRTLGLDGVLLTRDEGYLLDPKRNVLSVA